MNEDRFKRIAEVRRDAEMKRLEFLVERARIDYELAKVDFNEYVIVEGLYSEAEQEVN